MKLVTLKFECHGLDLRQYEKKSLKGLFFYLYNNVELIAQ